ncbi:hypothetical protein [Reinekea sp. G2M2-21]|uniref:hypothetical protein n=1 Tax=Reinekea sp. G2M2-21 TaxID=2788942 RepID=UPI0018A96A2E|nr:hypothetical protein [Reinekea sp. G2M2-21]
MNRDAFTVTRHVRLKQGLSPEQVVQLSEFLHSLPIDCFRKSHASLRVKYCAAELHWSQIEVGLKRLNLLSESSLLNQIRARWYRFVDENARINARSKTDHCCNKAPAVPSKR